MGDCPDCRCNDFEKCLKILNLMLDNEATSDQEAYFYTHIESCMVCFAHYNVEKQIRVLLQKRMSRCKVPSDLAQEIRRKIVD